MRIGLCCSLDALRAAVASGADYVEPAVAGTAALESPDGVWQENLQKLREAGLPAEAWNVLLPGDLKVVGPAADMPRLRRYLEVASRRLAEAGARVVVFGSGGSRTPAPGYSTECAFQEFVEAARTAADMFAPYGIAVCVEPLCAAETPVLNTVAEACAIVQGLGVPNLKVTADLYHMSESAESPEVSDMVPWIGHAHVADTGRLAPGTGSMPIAAFLNALRAGGYEGSVSIECSWKDLASEAGPSVAWLREATT